MFHGDTGADRQSIAQHSIVSRVYKKTQSTEGMMKHCSVSRVCKETQSMEGMKKHCSVSRVCKKTPLPTELASWST